MKTHVEERGKRRTSPRHLPSGIPTPSSAPDPETYPPGSVLKLEQQRNSKLWTGSQSQSILYHEEQSCPVSITQAYFQNYRIALPCHNKHTTICFVINLYEASNVILGGFYPRMQSEYKLSNEMIV